MANRRFSSIAADHELLVKKYDELERFRTGVMGAFYGFLFGTGLATIASLLLTK